MRRQMEALEERLGSQLGELRRQAERPREAALARLEEKLQAAESSGMRLDLRLSELTGNARGLSEEMQVQIKRVDCMDERLSEWRQRMEEELRQKYAEFEQGLQRAASSFRVSNSYVEEAQKRQQQRLQRLEAELSELGARERRTQEALLDAHGRLDAAEARLLEAEARPPPPAERCAAGHAEAADGALVSLLERRVGEVAERLEQVVQDSFEQHAALAAQEEQLRSLRTLSDAREEHGRALAEQLERGDVAAKLEKLRDQVQEEAKLRLQQLEDLRLLQRRSEYVEQSQEELRGACEQLASDTTVTMAVEECRARIEESEARLAALHDEVQAAHEATHLAPRLGALVSQLQALVPRVAEQEAAIRELQRAAGHGVCLAQAGGPPLLE